MSSLDELFERFPEMRPVSRPPSLFTLNGCGTRVYGRRDYDPETGTYVVTQWITLIYIPIIALAAYRVANAANGWYFLGRVPVSGLARGWTACLLLIAAGLGGWAAWKEHTGSTAYKERQMLEEGDRLRDKGRIGEAAGAYLAVAHERGEHAGTAVKSVMGLLDSPGPADRAKPSELAGVFRVAHELRGRPGALTEEELFDRGLRLAQGRGDEDPPGAVAVLEAVEDGAPAPEAVLPVKQKLLERVTADHPDDVPALGKLAVVYERTHQADRCLPLLEPHAKELGTSEGARVLGLIYAGRDKHEEAYALLQPYADAHLKELRDAETAYESAVQAVADRALADVQRHAAPGFDYAAFEKAAPERKEQMVNDLVVGRMKDDTDLRRSRDALARAAVVIPVALDLGMLQLERAQHLNDPAARKAELERAEKTFLSVRTTAGHSKEYRVSLGQVYYWLGKPAEGRKLFEAVLKDDGRKFESLMTVAHLMRELGAAAEARALSEEAYNQPGADAAKKRQAALLRALSTTDLDDEVVWLERSEATSPEARASLAKARGRKAERDGKDADAATFFREAAAVYAGLPENEATLNNGGLALLDVFRVTGEREALDRGVKMLEKALALRPGDGILAGNVAWTLLGIGLRDVVGDRIDLKKLKREAGLDLCSFLYADAAGRDALVRKAKGSAAVAKARAQLERALLLAPNNAALYQESRQLLEFLGDADGLARLARKAEEARPDVAAHKQEMLDFYQGKADDKYRREGAASVARAERTLAEARGAGGVTFAVAAVEVVRARVGQEVFGDPPDADALVRLAEEADRAAPSAATAGALEAALLLRASAALAAREPEYAATRQRVRRSLGSTYLIAVALWRDGKPRAAALADDDVKRVLRLVKAQAAAFPDEPGGWQWAMLRAAHPEEAGRVAEALKKDEKGRQTRALDARLSPASAAPAFQRCWALDSAGQSAEALDALRAGAAEGAPLPFDVK